MQQFFSAKFFESSVASTTLIAEYNRETQILIPDRQAREAARTEHGNDARVRDAENLLVRGATSSIGFATIALARAAGLELTATTRSATKADELVAAGATHVLVDDGSIAHKARAIYPDGFDRVLELVGATTLLDSLQAARRGGIVCMMGIHPRSFKNTSLSLNPVNSSSSSDRPSLSRSSGKRTPRWTRTGRRWRVCFRWKDADAYDVEIVDYH